MENIKNPEDYIEAMLERARKEYIQKTYVIRDWTDHEDFLAQFARKSGKLLKVMLHTLTLSPLAVNFEDR